MGRTVALDSDKARNRNTIGRTLNLSLETPPRGRTVALDSYRARNKHSNIELKSVL